jgi:hypothetical protein
VTHNDQMPQWQLEQLKEVGKFISSELRSKEPDDKETNDELSYKLFQFLFDQTMERLRPGNNLLPLTPKEVSAKLYRPSRFEDERVRGEKSRKVKSHLRHRLELFASSSKGKRLPWCFQVGSPEWELKPIPQSPATKRFWAPYFNPECKIIRIIYAESLFFRTNADNRAFLRHMDVNDPVTARDDIQKKWRIPSKWKLQPPGKQFVSAGDCAAVAKFVQQFERNGLETEITKADAMNDWTVDESKGEGLIVMGNGRIIPWLYERIEAEGFNLRITDDGIYDTQNNVTIPDDPLAKDIQGLILRTFSEEWRCWLTIIVANHGRFAERFATYLFQETEVLDLFGKRKWNDASRDVPKKFEIAGKLPVDPREVLGKRLGHGFEVSL